MQPDDDVSEFEDPALRSAIRRVWPAQAAPAELHRKLAQIAAAETRGGPGYASGAQSGPGPATPAARLRLAPIRPWYRHPLFSLAAAAIVLIGVGLVTIRFSYRAAPPPPALTLPDDLADNLVIRHDACCKAPDHHMPGLPRNDLQAIGVALRAKLGYPVISGEPSAAPWKFAGASVCDVGDVPGAHLIFKQPDENISIFSLPISVDPAAAGRGEFAMIDDGHPIAGFATASAFYAIVGSSTDNSLSLASVAAMCTRLRPLVTPAEAPQPSVASIGW